MAATQFTPYAFLIDEARATAQGLSDAAAACGPEQLALRERLTGGSNVIIRLIHAIRGAPVWRCSMGNYARKHLDRQRRLKIWLYEPTYLSFGNNGPYSPDWRRWPIGQWLIENRARLKSQGFKWRRKTGLKEVSHG
jgi:hypothetical protein